MDIAVVIITYNQREYVGEAIDSALKQTHEPKQVIVADDGSDDGTPEMIEEYAVKYPDTVFPVLNKENRGIPANFNSGLREVSADAVTFLAGDDRFRTGKLEHEADVITSNPEVDVAYSNFAYVNASGTVMRRWTDSPPPTGDVLLPCLERDWPDGAVFRNPMVSWDLLERVGFFDESLLLFEDWDMKIRLSAQTKVGYCDKVLTEYRQTDEGISSTADWRLKTRMFERVYEKHRDLIESLHEDNRRRVMRELDSELHRFRALTERYHGSILRAWIEYSSALRTSPSRLCDYRTLLRISLPRPAFQLLSDLKQAAESGGEPQK